MPRYIVSVPDVWFQQVAVEVDSADNELSYSHTMEQDAQAWGGYEE